MMTAESMLSNLPVLSIAVASIFLKLHMFFTFPKFVSKGAFMIPYVVMLCCAGIPIAYMEVALGQFTGQSTFEAFNCVPLLKGVGLGSIVISAFVGIYYIVIIAYTLHYFVLSFQSPLPWTTCNYTNSDPSCNEELLLPMNNSAATVVEKCTENCDISPTENYWVNIVLEVSDGVGSLGSLRPGLTVELMVSWVAVCLCLIKGTRSVGKVVYFTALFPYVALTALLIGVIRLDGASDGIAYLFTPRWDKLGVALVWKNAATQIFFSLSVGLGGLITLSSYNPFRNNCYRDIMIVALVNTFTSIYAGISVFATLGFMAKRLGREIETVVKGGTGLAFVAYPQAVTVLPFPQLWSCIFFAMLITLGLDTMFAVVETVTGAISDGFPHYFHKRKAMLTAVTCLIFFLLGLVIVTQGGSYWLDLLDTYAASTALLIIALIEVATISYVYGVNNFEEDIKLMLGKKPSLVFHILWKYITPVLLLIILLATLAQVSRFEVGGYLYPLWADILGWLIVVLVVGTVPVCAIYELHYRTGNLKQRIKDALLPNKLWRPFLDEDCVGKYANAAPNQLLPEETSAKP